MNENEELRKTLQKGTNTFASYLFIVFDLIFRDDTVRLLGRLPGELDAALLHLLLDDFADLGWSCLEKKVLVSAGQTSQHSEDLCELMNIHTDHSQYLQPAAQTLATGQMLHQPKRSSTYKLGMRNHFLSNIFSVTSQSLCSVVADILREPFSVFVVGVVLAGPDTF